MNEHARQVRLNEIQQNEKEIARLQARNAELIAQNERAPTVPVGYCPEHYADHREVAKLVGGVCYVCESTRTK